MNKILSTLVLAAALASPAFAEKAHDHATSKGQKMDGMMMGPDQKKAMHEHMQEMQEMQEMQDTMEKITAETDPEKRQQLMQEHMRAMKDGMHMMNDGMKMGMAKGGSSKAGVMDTTMRMKMMEERMDLMQSMMNQMMDHESESQKDPIHKHKT